MAAGGITDASSVTSLSGSLTSLDSAVTVKCFFVIAVVPFDRAVTASARPSCK